jgi:hypothetical protein
MTSPNTLRAGDVGADVTVLQTRLRAAGARLDLTGHYDADTVAAVRAYQLDQGLVIDGIAGPVTQAHLAGAPNPKALTQADIDRAAADLRCDPAAIQSVIAVEAPRGGFLPDGRVRILFERHIFWRQLTAAGLDPATLAAPASILSQQPGGYVGGAGEYPRLAAAARIHRAAAHASCSWGRFQLMGYHAPDLGYTDAETMAHRFAAGEAEHLAAFVRLLQADKPMLTALRKRRWSDFAGAYNGPAYADHLYDARLAQAWRQLQPPEAT